MTAAVTLRAARPDEAVCLGDIMRRAKQSHGYDDAFIEAAVDIVLAGVKSGAAMRKPRPVPSSARIRGRA